MQKSGVVMSRIVDRQNGSRIRRLVMLGSSKTAVDFNVSRRRKLLMPSRAWSALILAASRSSTRVRVQRRLTGPWSRPSKRRAECGSRSRSRDPRLWPARLVAEGVVVSIGGQSIAAIERVEASWRWRGHHASPRRDRASSSGWSTSTSAIPLQSQQPKRRSSTEPVDPWRAVEIGRIRIIDGRGGRPLQMWQGPSRVSVLTVGSVDGRATAP